MANMEDNQIEHRPLLTCPSPQFDATLRTDDASNFVAKDHRFTANNNSPMKFTLQICGRLFLLTLWSWAFGLDVLYLN